MSAHRSVVRPFVVAALAGLALGAAPVGVLAGCTDPAADAAPSTTVVVPQPVVTSTSGSKLLLGHPQVHHEEPTDFTLETAKGSVLKVVVVTGNPACRAARIEVTEHDDRIEVAAFEGSTTETTEGLCTADAVYEVFDVVLHAPVGSRTVVDARTPTVPVTATPGVGRPGTAG